MQTAGLVTLICEQWEEARRKGLDPTPEELCREHPEVLEEVRVALRNLKASDQLVGDTSRSEDRTIPRPVIEPSAPILPPDCRYRLIRFLAEGGLGRVYVGYDTELNREVAIKFILPTRLSTEDAVRRFGWEAEVTGRLEHPGIAPVYGLIRNPQTGEVAYAMRLLPGETLQDAAKRCQVDGRPEVVSREFRDLLAHFTRTCRTIGFAHARGFLHRDVKPSNVMVGPNGQTWVLDWGLAKAMAIESSSSPNAPLTSAGTRQGQLLGTPAYMAPEQAAGDLDEVGPASDVYALGGVLYFLLTGRAPHHGRTTADVLTRALNADVPPVRQLNPSAPKELVAVCRRALRRKREDRFASAEEMAEAVERYLAAPTAPRRGRRLLWAAIGGVALLLVAIVTAVVIVKVRTPDGKETTLKVPEGSQIEVDPKGGVTVTLPKDGNTPKDNNPPKEKGPDPPANTDFDRRAAEALKPHSKQLEIQFANGRLQAVNPGDTLPLEPFTLTRYMVREKDPHTREFVANVLLPSLLPLRNFHSIDDQWGMLPLTADDLAKLAESPCRDTLNRLLCGAELTPRAVDALKQFGHLNWLGIRAAEVDDSTLERLKELPVLQYIAFYHLNQKKQVTERGWAALETLRVYGIGLRAPVAVPTSAYEHITRLPLFTTIAFRAHCPGVIDIAALGKGPKLGWFEIQDSDIPKDRFRALRQLPHLGHLGLPNSKFDEQALRELADHPELATLNFQEASLTDNGLQILSGFIGVRYLDIRGCKVTADAVAKLGEAQPNSGILWDGGYIKPRVVASLVGEKPPAHNLFPGKVVLYDTFDDPKKSNALVGTDNGVKYAIEDGLYKIIRPDQVFATPKNITFGIPTRNDAFITRFRATNARVNILFRTRVGATRVSGVRVDISPPGHWRTVWVGADNAQGFRTLPERTHVQGETTEAELAPGKWITVAIRSAGNRYELWINGRCTTWANCELFGEDPLGEPKGSVASFQMVPSGPGEAKLEVDYIAVWNLSAKQ